MNMCGCADMRMCKLQRDDFDLGFGMFDPGFILFTLLRLLSQCSVFLNCEQTKTSPNTPRTNQNAPKHPRTSPNKPEHASA
jgi:hypothetical protein